MTRNLDSSLLDTVRWDGGGTDPPATDDVPATPAHGAEPAAKAAALEGRQQIGRFSTLRELGRGAMGVVFAAYDPVLDRSVALKLIETSALDSSSATFSRERVLREARAMAKVDHPNVMTVHDVGEIRGQVFIAMDHAAQGTLRQWCRSRRRSGREILAAFCDAGRGLLAAHRAGVIHRDFKPDNVLVSSDGRVRVADFGIARLGEALGVRPAGRLDESLTVGGQPIGTPAYMAPEQHRRGQVDAAADQFAFCVALWEALYGARPFAGRTVRAIRDNVLAGRIREPALSHGVPSWLERVLRRGLAVAPSARYPSMEELLVALEIGPIVRRRRIRLGVLALLAPLLAFLWVDAGLPFPAGERLRAVIDRHELSVLRPVPAIADLRASAAAQRRGLTPMLLRQWRDHQWTVTIGAPKQHNASPWVTSQALIALVSAPEVDRATVETLVQSLAETFSAEATVEIRGIKVGWRTDTLMVQAEPALWTLGALSALMRRDDREALARSYDLRAHLDYVEEVLDAYHPTNSGGWNMYPLQGDPSQHSTYTTTLALLALLELRTADLPWRGSVTRRDELLRSTAAWLVAELDSAASPPGWRASHGDVGPIADGLTIQIYATLLRAEAEAGLPLGRELESAIARQLRALRDRPFDYTRSVGIYTRELTRTDSTIATETHQVYFLWHPWAIELARRWLDRQRERGAPLEEQAATRRLLGHLVIDASRPALRLWSSESTETFVLSESLYAMAGLADLR